MYLVIKVVILPIYLLNTPKKPSIFWLVEVLYVTVLGDYEITTSDQTTHIKRPK